MVELITAKGALSISNKIRTDNGNNELININNIITENANKGHVRASYYKQISYKTLEYLHNAGFIVTMCTYEPTNQLYYIISWY